MTMSFSKSTLFFGLGLGLIVMTGGAVRAQGAPEVFKICQRQTYALCALANCFVMDGVSYCKCDVKFGNSISEPFNYGKNQDVCTTNAEGVENGYMVSTYSYPESVSAPFGNKALYDCAATTSPYGASAQCDGGICFKSTEGQSFPGFGLPLTHSEIICSCPIAVTDPATAKVGFQIVGPYPCQHSFFNNCASPTATPTTGASLYVGAPTGTPILLTHLLTGQTPAINRCLAP
jgi:hypothetical protein